MFLTNELLLGSIDTTNNEKIAKYMASIIDKFIHHVSPHNIIQICTNNASSMLKASQIIIEKSAWKLGENKASSQTI